MDDWEKLPLCYLFYPAAPSALQLSRLISIWVLEIVFAALIETETSAVPSVMRRRSGVSLPSEAACFIDDPSQKLEIEGMADCCSQIHIAFKMETMEFFFFHVGLLFHGWVSSGNNFFWKYEPYVINHWNFIWSSGPDWRPSTSVVNWSDKLVPGFYHLCKLGHYVWTPRPPDSYRYPCFGLDGSGISLPGRVPVMVPFHTDCGLKRERWRWGWYF